MRKYLALFLACLSPLLAAPGDTAPTLQDRQIVLQIRNQMEGMKYNNVTFVVIGGVVTINGTVTSQNDMTAILNIVNNVAGVQKIQNRMRIAVAPKAPLPPNNMTGPNSPLNPNDTFLTSADYLILFTLRNQLGSSTTYDNVTIGVASGLVSLQGSTATKSASQSLENAARIIPGVSSVVNNIQVLNDQQPAPAEQASSTPAIPTSV